MNRISRAVAIATAAGAGFCAAQAATVTVTPSDMQGWSNPSGENSGQGYSAVTATSPHDGTGSIELHGDRTRFVLGSLYSPLSNLGSLSNFTDLSFSYRIDPSSSNPLNAGYSPALRLTYWNNGTKDEFVFEQVYQAGGYGAEAPIGDWNVTSSSSTFYKKSNNNENIEMTLADWLKTGNFANAYVSAIYIGAGSSASSSYLAYADDVIANGTKYNFEADAVAGAVPEPASWAMMVGGFGLVGGAMRRRARAVVAIG